MCFTAMLMTGILKLRQSCCGCCSSQVLVIVNKHCFFATQTMVMKHLLLLLLCALLCVSCDVITAAVCRRSRRQLNDVF